MRNNNERPWETTGAYNFIPLETGRPEVPVALVC